MGRLGFPLVLSLFLAPAVVSAGQTVPPVCVGQWFGSLVRPYPAVAARPTGPGIRAIRPAEKPLSQVRSLEELDALNARSREAWMKKEKSAHDHLVFSVAYYRRKAELLRPSDPAAADELAALADEMEQGLPKPAGGRGQPH